METHKIACHELGFELTACELDKEYYDASIKRIQNRIGTKLTVDSPEGQKNIFDLGA